ERSEIRGIQKIIRPPMVHYRRNYLQGATYFFTVNLHDRRSRLLIEQINLLRRSLKLVQQKYPFQINATVILPEHLHAIWTLPESDNDYSSRWRRIKSHFTRGLLNQGCYLRKNSRHEYDIWQRRFWEHTIRNEQDFENHVNYIHYNPVKHALVRRVLDWPYSSFHVYVKRGLTPADWGDEGVIAKEMYGE
ncbi:transposase and inactivated derivatives, partial [Coxiella burnetii Q321]|uniref:REP-associated tyrosine transposase n=2 Tax=Coxiella burnetii TaxID=777 RepID=UPI000163A2CA